MIPQSVSVLTDIIVKEDFLLSLGPLSGDRTLRYSGPKIETEIVHWYPFSGSEVPDPRGRTTHP